MLDLSIPLNGSSNIIILGFSIKTDAIPSFCFIPNEYLPNFLLFSFCKFTNTSVSSISFIPTRDFKSSYND